MIGFLIGVAATMTLGFVVMLVDDPEVRRATVTVLWGLAIGPALLFVAVVVLSVRAVGLRPSALKGRRLSPAALQRFVGRLDKGGWVVTWRGGGLLMLGTKARVK